MKKIISAMLAVLMVLTTLQFTSYNTSAKTFTSTDVKASWSVSKTVSKSDADVKITTAGGYLLYKVTATTAGVYDFYTTGDADTYGYLLDAKTLDTNHMLADNDDGGDNSNCMFNWYLTKGETIYFAVRYYDEDAAQNAFTVMVEYDNNMIGVDGIIYKYSEENDEYSVVGQYLTEETAVTIPATIKDKAVTSIADNAFYECDLITALVVPSSVTSIGDYAFDDCTRLSSIKFNEGLKSIGTMAFSYSAVKSVTLPASLTSIDAAVFSSTPLEKYVVASKSTTYKAIDGVLYSYDGKELVAYPRNKGTEYTVPKDVEIINDGVFKYNDKITKVDMSKSKVTQIGNYAFYDAKNLYTVIMPENTLTTINEWAFAYAGMYGITIPKSVTKINYYAFYECDNLEYMVFECDTVSINGSTNTIPSGVVLYGNTDSTAASFGNTFVDLESIDCEEAHEYKISVIKTAPTCTKTGVATTACIKCGEAGSDTIVAKTEHVESGNLCVVCCQSESNNYILTANTTQSCELLNNMGTMNAAFVAPGTGSFNLKFTNANQDMDLLYIVVHEGTKESYGFTLTASSTEVISLTLTKGDKVFICGNSMDESAYADENYTFDVAVNCGKHNYTTKVVKPTYAAKGYTLHTCSVCGKSYKSDATAKLTVAKAAIKSVTAGSGKLCVKWGKKAYTGYQIQVSQNKNFSSKRTVTVKGSTNVKKTITGLKNKTKYYVRVRAYKTYKSKKYYSKWSKVVAKTTK